MAFYRNVAEKTENRAARDVFEMMAAEEQKHINTLSEQFKAYRKNKKFIPGSHDSEDNSMASKVLTEEIKEKISAAGFEAAAISAAILMEEQAVNLYSEGMENASDPEAKALFEWLTRWEREHLSLLLDIDKTLKEKYGLIINSGPFNRRLHQTVKQLPRTLHETQRFLWEPFQQTAKQEKPPAESFHESVPDNF